MNFSIFNYTNGDFYKDLLVKLNLKLDIYYTIEFLEVEAKLTNTEFEIFVLENDSEIFIYPYLRKNLLSPFNKYYDITSPYGYAGPFCTSKDLFFSAEKELIYYLKESGCITEFIRYHYLYNKDQVFHENISNIHNRNIIVTNLSVGWENVWTNQFSKTNRNVVRKMEKEAFSVIIDDGKSDLQMFEKLYLSTMVNAKANDFFHFKLDYFNNLFNKLDHKIFMAKVIKDDIIYAAALFFVSSNFLTYYLSARNINHSTVPASNLLLTEVAKFGVQNKLSYFNIGGGLTINEEDGLFKFKKNFSNKTEPFYIGKRINNPVIYTDIINNYILTNGTEAFNKIQHILQFYRL